MPSAQAHSEAELTSTGSFVTHYVLGNGNPRWNLSPGDVMEYRQSVATYLSRFYGCAELAGCDLRLTPVIRPCLVFCNKVCYSRDHPYRSRLLFDLDPIPNSSNDGSFEPLTFPWIRGFVSRLSDHLEQDVTDSGFVLFAGSYPDKWISAHLYLYDYCFAADEQNRTVPPEAVADLNDYCRSVGLCLDSSVTTSGIKLPYADKWKHQDREWRGLTMFPAFYDEQITTWQELCDVCDPCVSVVHDLTVQEVRWKPAAARPAPAAPAPVRVASAGVPVGSSEGSVQDRLRHLVPEWLNAEFRVRPKEGYEVWTANCAFCPFKRSDHRSCKCYVIVTTAEKISVRCHSANCRETWEQEPLVSNSVVDEPEQQEAVDWCNARFACLTRVGASGSAKPQVLEFPRDYDSPVKYYSQKDFHDTFQQWRSTVMVDTPNGPKPKTLVWTREWLRSKSRREYPNGVMLHPSGDAPPGAFNLWRGFNSRVTDLAETLDPEADETAAKCALITRHIRDYICGGAPDLFAYVLKWLAFTFQRPEIKPEVALVLVGARGAGKNSFVDCLERIVGQWHFFAIHEGKQLHKSFNAALMTSFLVYMDEAVAANHMDHQGFLKGFITNPHLVMELKFQDAQAIRSFHHVVMSANDEWAVPVGEHARRFQVMRVVKPTEPGYFDRLHAEIDGEGPAALYASLVAMDLTDWHPRQIVHTDILWRQQFHTMDPVHRWWYEVLKRGYLTDTATDLSANEVSLLPNHEGEWDPEDCFEVCLPKRVFYLAVTATVPSCTASSLWTKLKQFETPELPLFSERRTRAGGAFVRLVKTASLIDLRQAFNDYHTPDVTIWN